MADAFTQQQEEPQTTQLSFEERFALLVDRQWSWRQNRALERRLRDAWLQGPACMEDIDFRATLGLDKRWSGLCSRTRTGSVAISTFSW